jgi:Na+-driven multidrug efflux pump
MMAAEGPVLTSVIARLAEPKYNLAAYGVATAIAMIIESPIIMMLSASIALVRDKDSYRKLRRFTIQLNILITLGMLITLIPPVFNLLAYTILHLTEDVASLVYQGLACMIFWPAAIGFRRFWQGLLIRSHRTNRVAYGTVVRLVSMLGTAFLLSHFTNAPGTVIGGASLTVAVVLEALATRFMTDSTIKGILAVSPAANSVGLNTGGMIRYYTPLALTSLIGMAASPMLTFFIGHSPMPLESLAVLPVVDSFVFLFRSFGFSYQEVGIALLGDKHKNHDAILRFGILLAILTTGTLAILVFIPQAVHFVLEHMYGLTPELAEFAIIPSRILVILPLLSVSYSFFRSVIINARQNAAVTISTIIEVAGMIGIMIMSIWIWNPVGIISASIGMSAGRIFANIYLYYAYKKAVRTV